jgi:probable blue pigment (indigoidine) exporter
MKGLLIGLCFVMLWSSASVVTKFGLIGNEPFIISVVRFFIAGGLMLCWSHIVRNYRLPIGQEWKQIALYGVLNVSIYLSAFIWAMKEVSAGIGTLSLSLNPLIISTLSAFILKRPIHKKEILGLFLSLIGVGIATYPLLLSSHATPWGLLILGVGLLAYCIGNVYYTSLNWDLPIVVINGWQVLLGGLFLVPFMFWKSDFSSNAWDINFWGCTLWLAIPVSIGAVQLWLFLLKKDIVQASFWLFLCPISGFLYAYFFLDEPMSLYTLVGTLLVLVGLYIGKYLKLSTPQD